MVVVSFYVYRLRKMIDEMHGMMIGMTFGIITGLVTATLFLIPTGNFLFGVILGSLVGLLFGIPFGKLGGHLGIMEGTIAGPMGGMMGAMLGQMIRPFDIEIFIPFLTFIFLITLIGITYAVNCRLSCCMPEHIKRKKNFSKTFVLFWIFAVVLLFAASIGLSFSQKQGISLSQTNQNLKLPPYLQQLTAEERKEAVMKTGYQEIDIYISSSKYSPNTITAKKNIPLRINLHADENAGCAREIVFPDFGIDEIVPAGGKETIEILPIQEGEFKFRCSMDMIRGKLIII